jgi:hypothetical protein
MKSNFDLLFYLRKQKNYKGGPMAIYMRITVNGKRADMSAGRECDPAKWNSRAGRATGTKEEIKSLNNYLDSLQTKVRNAHQDATFPCFLVVQLFRVHWPIIVRIVFCFPHKLR